MTIQPGGEPEMRKYWDAEYPDKVRQCSQDLDVDH